MISLTRCRKARLSQSFEVGGFICWSWWPSRVTSQDLEAVYYFPRRPATCTFDNPGIFSSSTPTNSVLCNCFLFCLYFSGSRITDEELEGTDKQCTDMQTNMVMYASCMQFLTRLFLNKSISY